MRTINTLESKLDELELARRETLGLIRSETIVHLQKALRGLTLLHAYDANNHGSTLHAMIDYLSDELSLTMLTRKDQS